MSDHKEPVARETSAEKLLRESKERFLTFDQEAMISRLHLKSDENSLYVQFLGQEFAIDRKTAELTQADRAANSDEMAAIFEYLTKGETAPVPVGRWASVAQLCTNTTTTDLSRYAKSLQKYDEDLEGLKEACRRLGGTEETKGDVSFVLPTFPGVPVWFQYWEKDEEFPASVQFLWDASVPLHFRWATLWNIMDCVVNRLNDSASQPGPASGPSAPAS